MQTKTSDVKPKRGGPRAGAGRRTGSKGLAAIKRIAVKVLEQVLQDESAPHEARVTAACKLIDIDVRP